ncbi:LuxR C-terminal-related transcriptional regulator [Mycobacterium intracellulare]|uniref:LuxR C-terminal-related transcriptional regulator n=1 Tax=Mycobacterium intracellulare TaxID=1767 RepID=UPI001EEF32D5|nr:LuxR C-terminal-related transcriptional regulator [Mycobacterium intracellulare]MEE3753116.1 LuxR C-terminal-related transcriptional regulator [Mycobacterium intracellulare]
MDEIDLVGRLAGLREEVFAALGGNQLLPSVTWDAPWHSPDIVSSLTHACVGALRGIKASDPQPARRLSLLILDLQQLAMDYYLYETGMRGDRLAGCVAALSRLRGVASSAALMEMACEALVLSCGFHRAVLSRVQGKDWKLLMLHDRSNEETGAWFSDWVNQTVPLAAPLPENELLVKRRPSLVYDTDIAPVHRPLVVQSGQCRSYVVAPLIHGDRVIGFVHSDHHPLPRRVDESDRDVVWAFAQGFSHLYERAVLREQLRTQRDNARELLFTAVDRIDELCESGIESSRFNYGHSAALGDAPSTPDLTEREADVFHLMVRGASNQAIAEELVISVGTVKTHVKHILRKYGAVNRTQAIAWFLQERASTCLGAQ